MTKLDKMFYDVTDTIFVGTWNSTSCLKDVPLNFWSLHSWDSRRECILIVCIPFFFFFHWHYSPLWTLAYRTMFFHFFLSATNSLHLLIPSTWRSLSTSSFYPFLGLPLFLAPSSSCVKVFLGILFSSIPSRWPNQLILYPFIHFTIFSPLLIQSSSRFVQLFHSPFSYLGLYILLNIFLSKISRVCSSFFVNVLHSVLLEILISKTDNLQNTTL